MKVIDQKTLCAVKISPCNRVYYYESEEPVNPGDMVVVETMFGLRLGRVVGLPSGSHLPDGTEVSPVVRKATDEDIQKEEENRSLEEEAYQFCLERIKARGLQMKLVRTEVMLDRRRIVFYFTAEARVDFRELVRDLAARFRTRIEMRQIGVRDEAKMAGGIGICGRQVCCVQFLQDFVPISLKMAKDQELALNTSKLTGLCGRLMCCLSYEYEGAIEGEDEVPIENEDGTICEECYKDLQEKDKGQILEEMANVEESGLRKESQQKPTEEKEVSSQEPEGLLREGLTEEGPGGSKPQRPKGAPPSGGSMDEMSTKRHKKLKDKVRRKRHKRKKKRR